MDISLNTGGPHSPEYTQEVGDALAECVRVLNHATDGFDGLLYPGDVDRLISAVATMASRLPQLFAQAEENLTRIAGTPGLYDDRGGGAEVTVAQVSVGLSEAAAAANALYELLDAAHQASAHLGVRSGGEGSEDDG
jgi:hypothetical protein